MHSGKNFVDMNPQIIKQSSWVISNPPVVWCCLLLPTQWLLWSVAPAKARPLRLLSKRAYAVIRNDGEGQYHNTHFRPIRTPAILIIAPGPVRLHRTGTTNHKQKHPEMNESTTQSLPRMAWHAMPCVPYGLHPQSQYDRKEESFATTPLRAEDIIMPSLFMLRSHFFPSDHHNWYTSIFIACFDGL